MSYQTPAVRVTGAGGDLTPTGDVGTIPIVSDSVIYVNDVDFQGLGNNDATAANLWMNGRLLRKIGIPAKADYDGSSGIDVVTVALGKYLRPIDKLQVTFEVLTGAGFDVSAACAPSHSDFN